MFWNTNQKSKVVEAVLARQKINPVVEYENKQRTIYLSKIELKN